MPQARDGQRRYQRLIFVVLLLLGGCASIQPPPRHPEAIATSHPLATQAALRALEQGGNAYDAAIAATAVLSVVEPYDAGLGGGALWLLQDDQGKSIVIDAREMAPQSLSAKPSTNVDTIAIPGVPAALTYVGRDYAERPLEADLADAIRLARGGFIVDEPYRQMVSARLNALRANPAAAAVFLRNGQVPAVGTLIRQPALAQTLTAMAKSAGDAFYRGATGRALLEDLQHAGAHWNADTLDTYRITTEEPLRVPYAGETLLTTPSPSTGGLRLAQMFGMLTQSPLPPADVIARTHHLVEIMRRADIGPAPWLNAMRLRQLTPSLLATTRLQHQISSIDPLRASASGTQIRLPADQSTTLVIVDSRGNRAVVSLTLGRPFGAGILSAKTGVLLNDALNDASPLPKAGLRAGARPLTSMTPVILNTVRRDLLIGANAGNDSPAVLFRLIAAVMDGTPLKTAVAAPRYSQDAPGNRLIYEPEAFDREQLFQLQALGHHTQPSAGPLGNVQAVESTNTPTSAVTAVSDSRGSGQAIVHHPG